MTDSITAQTLLDDISGFLDRPEVIESLNELPKGRLDETLSGDEQLPDDAFRETVEMKKIAHDAPGKLFRIARIFRRLDKTPDDGTLFALLFAQAKNEISFLTGHLAGYLMAQYDYSNQDASVTASGLIDPRKFSTNAAELAVLGMTDLTVQMCIDASEISRKIVAFTRQEMKRFPDTELYPSRT